MIKDDDKTSTPQTETQQDGMNFEFELFVSETSPGSVLAIMNLEKLCEALGNESCSVRIVDVQANPERAEEARVFAVPTLIKRSPNPVARVIGDLGDRDKILALFRPRKLVSSLVKP